MNNLSTLSEFGKLLCVMLCIPACVVSFHIGLVVKRDRIQQERSAELQALQSSLDHERNYTALLSRILGEREQAKQLEGSK